jgi:pimeloyl-ACP methyl ester carboxylesterase
MAWAEFGDPDGDPVLWFHGTPGARCQVPSDIGEQAALHRLRIIAIERPGTGDSSPHLYPNIGASAKDFLAVADDLGIDKFAMVSLSGGGPYSLAVAAAAPARVTSLVVLGGVGPTRGPDAIISYVLAAVVFGPLLEKVRDPLSVGLSKILRTATPLGRPLINAFFRLQYGDHAVMTTTPDHKEQLLADLYDAALRNGVGAPIDDLILFGRDWGFELRQVKVPVTFWGSANDPIVPYVHAERQSKRVPNARLRTVVRRGHFAGYTEANEVFETIRSHWPAAATKTPAKKTPAKKKAPAKKPATAAKTVRRNQRSTT